MAVRQNFKPAEREAFTTGADIEWLNGSRWVPARITDGTIRVDSISGKYIEIEYTGPTTARISKGLRLWGTPGQIRIPA
jgi:hypothetical protein